MPKVCRDQLVLFFFKIFFLVPFAVTSLQVVLEDILVVDYCVPAWHIDDFSIFRQLA